MPIAKPATKQIQADVPADLVDTIDKIATREMISRAAWIRRTVNNAVKYARWHASLNKQS